MPHLPHTLVALVLMPAAVTPAHAQQPGDQKHDMHPPLTVSDCTASGCTPRQASVVVDANWMWVHKKGTYTNCYEGNQWDKGLCPDPATCAKNCALDAGSTSEYESTYGISTSGNALKLQFVTKNSGGENVGSRTFLMADDDHYQLFNLKNKEFTFDVDVSNLPCGLNGALYFVNMDADGGLAKYPGNTAGARYGTGYCDGQCPHDIKFINGEANLLNWTGSDSSSGTGEPASPPPQPAS
jgi:cellulose 1,4-beta-cellobiosidase|eukprot:COSAG01_NODE_10700_length_2100_cov_2.533733_1_plen_240_part_00